MTMRENATTGGGTTTGEDDEICGVKTRDSATEGRGSGRMRDDMTTKEDVGAA